MQDSNDSNFNMIYERYKNLVMKLAVDRIHDYDAAQEICQISFMEYYIQMNNIKDEFIKPWLMLVARNASIDYLRKMNVRKDTESLEALEEIGYEIVRDSGTEKVVNKVIRTELIYEILYELKQMNQNWYDIIVSLEILDRSQNEVAEELGIPLPVLRARLYRARCWIRENYGDDYDYSE